jgi:O-acetyl-ADP-ribose deacetylase (regulator of RNase III)
VSKIIQGNIFDGVWDVMMHVANCYHTMGGGIAREIAKRFPEVYAADKETVDDETKLGHYSFAEIPGKRVVYNLYAQTGIGNNGDPLKRNLRYDSFFDSLFRVFRLECSHAAATKKETLTIALPYGIGCGLAGGNWEIAKKIIDEVEKAAKKGLVKCKLNVHIYRLYPFK